MIEYRGTLPKLTSEDLQLLFDCLVFSLSTNCCWDAEEDDRDQVKQKLLKKFAYKGWKNSNFITLFKSGPYEESISDLIEQLGCTEINKQ